MVYYAINYDSLSKRIAVITLTLLGNDKLGEKYNHTNCDLISKLHFDALFEINFSSVVKHIVPDVTSPFQGCEFYLYISYIILYCPKRVKYLLSKMATCKKHITG